MDKKSTKETSFREKLFALQCIIAKSWTAAKPIIITLLYWMFTQLTRLVTLNYKYILHLHFLLFYRGPRLVHNRNNASIKDNTNQDNYLNPKTNNYADNLALLREMGVSTVLKDYGTDILDAIRGNDLHRLQLILEKQLKGDSKIARVCVTDIKHRPSKKFACPLILAARQEDPAILQWMMSKRVSEKIYCHS